MPGGSSGGSAAAVAAGLAPWRSAPTPAARAPARGAVRHRRPQTDVRLGVALRHDRLRLLAGPGRAAHARRGRRGAAARAHGRPRPARRDVAAVPRGDRACRAPSAWTACAWACPAELQTQRGLAGADVEPACARRSSARSHLRRSSARACRRSTCRTPPHALSAYYILSPSEASSNLARFDGVRYGMRAEARQTCWTCTRARATTASAPEVKRRIMLGTYALSAGYYDAYYGRRSGCARRSPRTSRRRSPTST